MNISQFLTKLKTLVYSKNEMDAKLSAVVHTSGAEDISGNKNFIDNLTRGGKNVDVIEEQGYGYVRYSSGIQICWGSFLNLDTEFKYISFQKPFIRREGENLYVSAAGQSWGRVIIMQGWDESGFWVNVNDNMPGSGGFIWHAIGRWKE